MKMDYDTLFRKINKAGDDILALKGKLIMLEIKICELKVDLRKLAKK